MKSFRLLGLFLVSLFLAACWLSSLPAAEHPWDEDEVVASDTNGVIQGNGGDITPGGTVHIIVLIDADLSLVRVFGSGMLYLRSDDDFQFRKGEVHMSSRERAAQTGTDLPQGKVSTRK